MPYTPTPHLLVETDGPVTILTLNNPDMRNAFLDDMHDAMQEIWTDLSKDGSAGPPYSSILGRTMRKALAMLPSLRPAHRQVK